MKHQKLFLITLLLSLISLKAEQPPKMIVFIHGTVKPVEFSFSALFKIMKSKIENSVYMKTAKAIRKDPFFFQGQPMQYLGLHPITKDSPSPAAICFTHLFDIQYDYLYKNPPKRLYYTYGWDGLLSIRKRYEAGENLYKELAKEVKRLQSQGINPSIDLYCYSYGGSVALNLAAVRDDNPKLDRHAFTIDNLILFGVPIQKATDYLASNNIFKKIYNFYSREDSIQTMDIFSSRELSVGKHFSNRSEFEVPEKVTQIRLRLTKKLRGANKIKVIPKNPYELLASKRLKKKHTDSGHSELWNFRWGAYWYRDYLAIDPLPVASFAPAFIHAVNTYVPTRRHLTLDYSRKYNGALLTGKHPYLRKAIPILTPKITREMYALAYKYRPIDFSVERQGEKTQEILKKIKQGMRKNSPLRKSKLLMTYLLPNAFPEAKKVSHSHLLSAKL